MGGKCPHRGVKKRRRDHKTARRAKFLVKGDDAIYDELKSQVASMCENPTSTIVPDEDLPGMGQFYCLHCDRHFANNSIREEHFRSKRHKRQIKVMKGPAPHNQLDADMAAGMAPPDNGPKLQSSSFTMTS